eukprot:6589574-Prymnesium_polylepis.1
MNYPASRDIPSCAPGGYELFRRSDGRRETYPAGMMTRMVRRRVIASCSLGPVLALEKGIGNVCFREQIAGQLLCIGQGMVMQFCRRRAWPRLGHKPRGRGSSRGWPPR